ncbi:parallel beta helix pectate lyase-like protein [Roseimicrobium gellanilyticum]|uniref:Parallel beta helix pectate lyase-like protein n=1 Tax=Roseimicrobium gellanilyticum TaxID=748857 RepID=A0A366HIH4_9BACT|nr:right-handed parallel beta-helix repeat-containing protein [Roseimicrobium gellanilyticum]RBP42567.1 parallel beta helix pectate lyase-like protein [Roseimicrobium gellanilyticum]
MLLMLCLTSVLAASAQEDFRPQVNEALKRGEKRIVIAPGTYRLAPLTGGGGELWNLSGLKDVEIIAEGVTLVGTKLMRAISLHRCSGVTLQGLTVDYDPLPFTQGEVIAAAEDASSIDIKIHAGYPRRPYSRVDVIDAKTRYRKKGMPFLWGTKAEMVGEDVVRVRLAGIGKAARPGDLASLSTGQEAGAPHAISVDSCERITFRNVTVHSAPGMGILEADGEGGSSFVHCKIVPGPKPPGAAEERLLSTSWDAFQSKTIRKGPLVEHCEIFHAGDDSWSVQSSDHLVLKNEGGVVVLASRDEFTEGVQLGDRLRTSVSSPEYRIASRKVVPRKEAALSEEVLAKLAGAEAWSAWKVSPKCIVVTLDRAADLKSGDSVYSPDRMGNGFVFRHNHVHSPGRILLKAGGLMEGNVLDTPHALIACPELPGTAAVGIEDMVIKGNTIRNGGWFCAAPWSSQAGVISITATLDNSKLRAEPVYKHVCIEGNTVEGGAGPSIVISSTDGATIRNNQIVSPQQDAPPDTGASYGIPKDAVIWIHESKDVTVEGNVIENAGSFAAGQQVQIQK